MSTEIGPAMGLLQGLTTGGVGAVIVAVLIVLYKCLQKRRIKSHSGCIDFEISDSPQPTPPPPTPVARTPVPSAEGAKAPRRISIIAGGTDISVKPNSEEGS